MSTDLSPSELRTLVRLAKKALRADPQVRSELQRHKVNILPANFYSDVPAVDEIYASFEYREPQADVFNAGLFDPHVMRDFIDELCRYAGEFDPPLDSPAGKTGEFFWNNPAFSYSDAEPTCKSALPRRRCPNGNLTQLTFRKSPCEF